MAERIMISDDDLLLYYYRDGLDAAERARIGTALAEHPELAQRLHRLVAQLDTAADLPEIPVPPHIRQRWESALNRAAHTENKRGGTRGANARGGFFSAFPWQAAAAAAVVIVAILVTVQVSRRSPPEQTAETPSPAATNAASAADALAYERGLRWHLANTQQQLARLDSAQPDERSRLVETIIEQNRMYALAAERANEPQLARVLRAFTPILESLASERRDASASDLAQLNFELRVIQARLKAAADPSPTAQPVAL
jgi:anti-sigma-K factor RskA